MITRCLRIAAMTDEEVPLAIAEGLSKWYGRQLGCRDVSFCLYEGEVIAVVGESGSGKSTLLRLLCAELAPSAGKVLYRMRDGVTRDLTLRSEEHTYEIQSIRHLVCRLLLEKN